MDKGFFIAMVSGKQLKFGGWWNDPGAVVMLGYRARSGATTGSHEFEQAALSKQTVLLAGSP